MLRGWFVLVKVKAKLFLDNDREDVLYLDVPKEKCNREEFARYIKNCLLAQYVDEIKFDYQVLGETSR